MILAQNSAFFCSGFSPVGQSDFISEQKPPVLLSLTWFVDSIPVAAIVETICCCCCELRLSNGIKAEQTNANLKL